jgi:hypothetical protein
VLLYKVELPSSVPTLEAALPLKRLTDTVIFLDIYQHLEVIMLREAPSSPSLCSHARREMSLVIPIYNVPRGRLVMM